MWPTGPDGCPLLGSGLPPAGRCPECAIFAGDSVQFQAGANSAHIRILNKRPAGRPLRPRLDFLFCPREFSYAESTSVRVALASRPGGGRRVGHEPTRNSHSAWSSQRHRSSATMVSRVRSTEPPLRWLRWPRRKRRTPPSEPKSLLQNLAPRNQLATLRRTRIRSRFWLRSRLTT